VAYQEFLRANGINPEDLSQKEYSDIINTQEMYNDDLIHFSNSENCKEVSHIGWGLQNFLCSTLPSKMNPLGDGLGSWDVGAISVPPHLSSPGKDESKASFLTPVCPAQGPSGHALVLPWRYALRYEMRYLLQRQRFQSVLVTLKMCLLMLLSPSTGLSTRRYFCKARGRHL
jgi:hypothetical protein